MHARTHKYRAFSDVTVLPDILRLLIHESARRRDKYHVLQLETTQRAYMHNVRV